MVCERLDEVHVRYNTRRSQNAVQAEEGRQKDIHNDTGTLVYFNVIQLAHSYPAHSREEDTYVTHWE